nr:hypothetical protein ISGA_10160 [Gordonia sp. NB41Y]
MSVGFTETFADFDLAVRTFDFALPSAFTAPSVFAAALVVAFVGLDLRAFFAGTFVDAGLIT